jgi:hypothetical protein
MPATVTLTSTTLAAGVTHSQKDVRLASATGVLPGVRLFIDRELMAVVSVGVTTPAYTAIEVQRGVGGTSSTAHSSTALVYIGNGDQFYATDPVGAPPVSIPVSPYINVKNGKLWFSQGDAYEGAVRWWQEQVTTYDPGALGIDTQTTSPTSST